MRDGGLAVREFPKKNKLNVRGVVIWQPFAPLPGSPNAMHKWPWLRRATSAQSQPDAIFRLRSGPGRNRTWRRLRSRH